MSFPAPARLAAFASVALALASCATFATIASADGRDVRDHITIGAGAQKFTNDNFDLDGLDSGPLGHFAFRHSIRKGLDFAFEFRATWANEDVAYDPTFPSGARASVSTVWAGGGVRVSGKREGPRPYGQFNIYFLTENLNLKGSVGELPVKNVGFGVGAQAGVEFALSSLLSIPIEACVLTGDAEGSITCVGASAGLTFNFGPSLDAPPPPQDF